MICQTKEEINFVWVGQFLDSDYISLNSCVIQNGKEFSLGGTCNESAKLNNWWTDPWNLYFHLPSPLLPLRAIISLIRSPLSNALFDNLRDRKGFSFRRPVSDLDNEPTPTSATSALPRGYSYTPLFTPPPKSSLLYHCPPRDSSKFNYSTLVTAVRKKRRITRQRNSATPHPMTLRYQQTIIDSMEKVPSGGDVPTPWTQQCFRGKSPNSVKRISGLTLASRSRIFFCSARWATRRKNTDLKWRRRKLIRRTTSPSIGDRFT